LTSPLPSTGPGRSRRRVVRPRIIVHRARPPSPPTRTLGHPPIGWPERPKALVLPSTLIFKHRVPAGQEYSHPQARATPQAQHGKT